MSWVNLQQDILEIFIEAHHRIVHEVPAWLESDRARKHAWLRRQIARGLCIDCKSIAVAKMRRCKRHLLMARASKRRNDKGRAYNRNMSRALRANLLPQKELRRIVLAREAARHNVVDEETI